MILRSMLSSLLAAKRLSLVSTTDHWPILGNRLLTDFSNDSSQEGGRLKLWRAWKKNLKVRGGSSSSPLLSCLELFCHLDSTVERERRDSATTVR